MEDPQLSRDHQSPWVVDYIVAQKSMVLSAKGSGACEHRGQTRHSRYTAYPPAGPRLHVSLLAARARAAQGLPPLRLELPKVTTPRNPTSRVCFVCEEGTKHEHSEYGINVGPQSAKGK